jgi:hypothetical protein
MGRNSFLKQKQLQNPSSEPHSRQFNGPGCVAGVVALG